MELIDGQLVASVGSPAVAWVGPISAFAVDVQ